MEQRRWWLCVVAGRCWCCICSPRASCCLLCCMRKRCAVTKGRPDSIHHITHVFHALSKPSENSFFISYHFLSVSHKPSLPVASHAAVGDKTDESWAVTIYSPHWKPQHTGSIWIHYDQHLVHGALSLEVLIVIKYDTEAWPLDGLVFIPGVAFNRFVL